MLDINEVSESLEETLMLAKRLDASKDFDAAPMVGSA